MADKLAAKTAAFQRAYLGSLPRTQAKSGEFGKYCQTLTNFEFLEAKINHPEFGVLALIRDYYLAGEPEVLKCREYSPEKGKALKLIQGALGLSVRVLNQDKTRLAEQLWGRLQCFKQPEIQQMLDVAKLWKDKPWLRPLTPSFTTPGDQLLHTLKGHSDWVSAVAVTPDGSRAISGSRDGTVKVWNLDSGEELLTLEGHSAPVYAVAVTPDGSRAISGSRDGTVKVWNLDSGEELHTLKGHSDWVNAVAVTPDGLRAISGSDDGTVKVWNLVSGKKLHTLKGHSGLVNAVAVTPDGLRAISGSDDRTVKIWDLRSGKLIASFTGDSPIKCCAVAQDGVTVVAGEESGRVHFLRLEGDTDA
nr:WD40 repeat domain-containing protein [Oscillatoria sp. PCC 10802]